jgi:hypothetical protein
MNKTILSLVGCSGSIATVIASATIANPDTTKTTPYPEVMNLRQVPRFNELGMMPQPQTTTIAQAKPVNIAQPVKIDRAPVKQAVAKAKPAKVVREELVSQSVTQLQLMKKYGIECASCRHLSPTVMVMGYSSAGM